PNHYAITAAAAQNYTEFYEKEIAMRKELNYPPFSKLIKLTVSDAKQPKSHQKALALFHQLEQLDQEKKFEIQYYPSLIPRLKNVYRWHILISGHNPSGFLKKMATDKNQMNLLENVIVDVDPLSTV
ncbi:MAG TPA: hypothetical protein VI588_01590, partial [Candidatus Gracilibacteria bacterium]|nr:hypothetical protein [Candidatus Gracilibacteria bacterium]